jgi:hypothetical protein
VRWHFQYSKLKSTGVRAQSQQKSSTLARALTF